MLSISHSLIHSFTLSVWICIPFGIDVIHRRSCIHLGSRRYTVCVCKPLSWIIARKPGQKNGKLTVMKIAACLLSNSDGQDVRSRQEVCALEHEGIETGTGNNNNNCHDADDTAYAQAEKEISIYLYFNNKPVGLTIPSAMRQRTRPFGWLSTEQSVVVCRYRSQSK